MKSKYRLYITVGLTVLMCLCACGRSDAPVALEPLSDTDSEDPEYAETDPAVSSTDGQTTQKNAAEEEEENGDAKTVQTVKVHVCGAVRSPGVYELPAQARVADAILAAGDFEGDADIDYWNQASLLTDGQQIYVPTEEETQSGLKITGAGDLSGNGQDPLMQQGSGQQDGGKLNINTASLSELMKLPGIGEVKAGAILSYREAKGGFGSVDEILKVDGIKEGVYQKISGLICVR